MIHATAREKHAGDMKDVFDKEHAYKDYRPLAPLTWTMRVVNGMEGNNFVFTCMNNSGIDQDQLPSNYDTYLCLEWTKREIFLYG